VYVTTQSRSSKNGAQTHFTGYGPRGARPCVSVCSVCSVVQRRETGDSPRALERGVPDPINAQTQRPGGLVNSLAVGYGLNEIAEDIP
jgi:hypothetical protein